MKMSELRERIAVTIYGAASQWDDYPWDALAGHIQALYLGQADAVIRELSAFHREVSEDDFLDALLGEDDETD
jgi:hypothetical protein